jgi:integrase
MKLKYEYPRSVDWKGVKGTIHTHFNQAKKLQRFQFRYFDNGRPKVVSRSNDEDEIEEVALDILKQLGNGKTDLLTVSGTERVIYERAVEILKPLRLPLDMVVMQFADAQAKLNGRATLTDVVDSWLNANPEGFKTKLVPEAVEEFIAESQQRAGTGEIMPVYVRDLRTRLRKFAERFACAVATIKNPDVIAYLDSKDVKPRTRKNIKTTIVTFFSWCKAKGYLPDNHPAIKDTRTVSKRITDSPPGILSLEDRAKLFAAAAPKVLVPMACTGLGGLRSEETKRVTWDKHVDLKNRWIDVPGPLSKTGVARRAPMPEALRLILLQHQRSSGPLCIVGNLANAYGKTAKRAGVKWSRNALRNSFISYRIALKKNIDAVALEAGNSRATILRYYFKALSTRDGRNWFSTLDANGAASAVKSRESKTQVCKK